MLELTRRQQEILDLIRRHIEKSGLPPTRADICAALGFKSPNAAESHLRALEAKGVIEMTPGASRGIRIVAQGAQSPEFSLPVVGRVAAGAPILAVESVEDHYRIDPRLFKPRADYLLRVRGMSMRDAGILDGDLLAVHKTRRAESGDIVVARVNDEEVTVKRFHQRSAYLIRLLPENPDFNPIEIDLRADTLAIEGLGVGVLRERM
ncbi:LexA repressor [Sulfuricaulis limicola]|uniref:LexA repressor n=1 Tax=Sulfuricaulis limicola TaxID=1620215 RepID=A0A1B4XD81_9GAMM|nr:transcriptional repressor LexA [Sulfuricaulis limicola]BAV32759.1 LexA repressor [Sulfuricaulis limicola]